MGTIDRRSALGAFLSLVSLLFMPLVSLAGPKKRKLLIEFSDLGPFAVVHGDYEAKEAFHLAWQAILWPTWKTDGPNHARKQYDRCLAEWANGNDVSYWASRDMALKGVSWRDVVLKAAETCGIQCEIRDKRERVKSGKVLMS